MTRTRRTPKRKSRRVLLAEAIRRDCGPLLFSLGFRHPRTNDLNRWGGITRRNAYLRWRETTFDSVGFYWDKYNRPKCYMEFETSTVVRRSEEGLPALREITTGSMSAWTTPISGLGSGWFGPWRSIDSCTAQIKRRILQLERFLQTGERVRCISAGPPRLNKPDRDDGYQYLNAWGDPWLDPESDYREDAGA
jgi:hypothetical protein